MEAKIADVPAPLPQAMRSKSDMMDRLIYMNMCPFIHKKKLSPMATCRRPYIPVATDNTWTTGKSKLSP
jgi:hypothetical protein